MAVTTSSPPSGDPDEHARSVEDSDWIRSVVSAALVHANVTDEQAGRVLSAATATPNSQPVSGEGVSPFSRPAKPQAEDWPELAASANIDATKARLAAGRGAAQDYFAGLEDMTREIEAAEPSVSDLYGDTAVASGAATTLLKPSPVEESTPSLPVFGETSATDTSSLHDAVAPQDEVMVESDASVEGYRQSDMRTVIEWLVVIFLAFVVAVLAKEFVVQAFWIPSPSMETTVNTGDRVLVNKITYEFNDVRRGDLVVFEKLEGTPGNTDDLIKRAIALPGETIELREDGRLWIWGPGETPDDALLLDEPYLDPQNELLNPPTATDAPSDTIWHDACVNDSSIQSRCTLDDSSYYMMGDNRSNSADSRTFGPVPEENLIGRAFFRIWPLGAISTL